MCSQTVQLPAAAVATPQPSTVWLPHGAPEMPEPSPHFLLSDKQEAEIPEAESFL